MGFGGRAGGNRRRVNSNNRAKPAKSATRMNTDSCASRQAAWSTICTLMRSRSAANPLRSISIFCSRLFNAAIRSWVRYVSAAIRFSCTSRTVRANSSCSTLIAASRSDVITFGALSATTTARSMAGASRSSVAAACSPALTARSASGKAWSSGTSVKISDLSKSASQRACRSSCSDTPPAFGSGH